MVLEQVLGCSKVLDHILDGVQTHLMVVDWVLELTYGSVEGLCSERGRS